MLLFGGQSCTALSFSALWPIRCIVRAFSCFFLPFRVFSCLFGLLAFMCTVHVFSPTFCGLSRRWLRGSELVRALVRRLLQSPLPCGVPSGLVRPLFRGVGVGSRVFWWLAGVVFWPRLFWLCAIGTRTLLRFARKKNALLILQSVKKCLIASI